MTHSRHPQGPLPAAPSSSSASLSGSFHGSTAKATNGAPARRARAVARSRAWRMKGTVSLRRPRATALSVTAFSLCSTHGRQETKEEVVRRDGRG